MTREDREFAKSRIEYLLKVDDLLDKHDREALDMAIKALSQEPTDAISREAVLQAVSEGCQEWRGIYGRCEELINALPSVNPQPSEHFIDGVHAMGYREGYKDAQKQKSGKWIDYSDEGYVECPFCGHATNCEDDIDELHYCFYCGARMESEVSK